MGCGGIGFEAQALSASASVGKAGFKRSLTPLIDGALLGGRALRGLEVGGAGGFRGSAVIGYGRGKGRLLAAI